MCNSAWVYMSEMVMFDVVEEILSRLLVKDLLRCKSVCKSWYSLISSPSFVRLQCKYICDNKDHNTRIAMRTEYGYDRWRWRWTVGGSSNGLVCMYSSSGSDEPIRVTNPLTRKCRELLRPPRLYSFGYTLKDGEKNAFHLEEDGETERNKRKRKRSGSRN
ncbi:putative F-box domain-containing protein [Tanacetum coccineum]